MKLTVVHFLMSSAFSNLSRDGWWLYERRQIESHDLFAYIDTRRSAFSFVYAVIRR